MKRYSRGGQAAALLQNCHYISSRRFSGDYGACDTLIDLSRAIWQARLTDRQREVVTCIYEGNMTQSEAARAMNVSQEAVHKTLTAAHRRINLVYTQWDNPVADVRRGGDKHGEHAGWSGTGTDAS